MKNLFRGVATLTAILVNLGCSQAQTPDAGAAAAPAPVAAPGPDSSKTLRLFVIGNSFSGNAMQYFPRIAKDRGYNVVVGRAEIGGAPLQTHADAMMAAEKDPADPKGKPYSGKSLRDLLSAGTWDIVTIQQGSFVSSAIDTYQPYATQLRDFIKKVQPGAEVMMHQTWAYRSDSDKFGAVRPNHLADTQKEMWEESRAAYQATAKQLGVRLIPVGDAFWRVASDPTWGYKKDPNFDFKNPVFPNLPDQSYSLNIGYGWGKDKTFGIDARHANAAGCYLIGLVWYGVIFGESPEKVSFAPPEVPAPFAAFLRKVAAETVAESGVKTGFASNAALVPVENVKPAPAIATPQNAEGKPGLTTAQGRGADTSVRGGEMSGRNFGHLDILRVRNSGTLINARKAYLRFDVGALPAAVKTAKNATLSLTVGAAEGASPADKTWTFQVFGLKDGSPLESWPEPTTNWDNAPANDAKSGLGLTEDAGALGTFTVTGTGTVGQVVTLSSPALLKFVQDDSNGLVTFIIARTEAGDKAAENVVHIFASRENKNLAAPALNVGF